MSMIASPARLRLYGTPKTYAIFLRDFLTGRFNRGDAARVLERNVASRLGQGHAVAMPTCRMAIYSAIKSVIEPGQRVIMSPYTIVDVVNMVICAGGEPVFADTAPNTCNADEEEIERLLKVTENVGAVLVTHFYGLMCDVPRVKKACDSHSVPLIEDAAQAFGAHIDGHKAGTIGDIGCFSFGMYKIVNAFFGGMLTSDNPRIAETVRADQESWPAETGVNYGKKLAQGFVTDVLTHPIIFKSFTFWIFRYAYLHDVSSINNQLRVDYNPQIKTALPTGYKRRLSAAQSRMIDRQLDGVVANTEKRIKNAKRYHDGLKDIEELVLPPFSDRGDHIYTYYCPCVPDRTALVRYAKQHNRDIPENYHKNCADLEIFRPYHADCPNARRSAAGLIYLPTYPSYPASEIDKNIAVIRAFFGKDT